MAYLLYICNMDKEHLKQQAEYYKKMYIAGYVSEEMARDMIQPYLNVVNVDCQNIAKAYGRYFEKITFNKFIKTLDK